MRSAGPRRARERETAAAERDRSTPREHADARARLHPVTPSQRRFSISLHDVHVLLAQTRAHGQGRRPPARR